MQLLTYPPATGAAAGLSSYPIGHRLPAGLKALTDQWQHIATKKGLLDQWRHIGKNYPRTRVDAPIFSAIVIPWPPPNRPQEKREK